MVPMKASVSKRNKIRQAGSLKIWIDDQSKWFWASVRVHHGRTTDLYRGPHASTVEGAVEALNDALKSGI